VILQGDALARLRELPAASIQCCCTSPPYYGLRDYGTDEWEGGDPACDHVLLAHPPGAGSWAGRANVAEQRNENFRSACGKCGARRAGRWTGGDPDCDHSQAPTRTVGNAPSQRSTLTTNSGQGPKPGDKFHADQLRLVANACQCGAVRADGQIGLEATPDEYIARLIDVFAEVKRVLRDDGTLWLNIGDSYAGTWGAQSRADYPGDVTSTLLGGSTLSARRIKAAQASSLKNTPGCKPKDLLGIPWMLALALRADGWYLRSDIIWAKPNPMPESVTDRPTGAHEHVFLLAKSLRYFYDADAIRDAGEPYRVKQPDGWDMSTGGGGHGSFHRDGRTDGAMTDELRSGRNKRNVWEIATEPYPDAHFATFPTRLVDPCVLAGSSPRACGRCGAPWQRVTEREDQGFDGSRYGERAVAATGGAITGGTARSTLGSGNGKLVGVPRTAGWEPTCDHQDDSARSVVLDPFCGSGTVGVVCGWHGREFIGIELNPGYCEMAQRRIESEGRLGRRAYRPEAEPDNQLALL
jgi:DNA modification methylase